MRILVLNSGSSSVKFAVVDSDRNLFDVDGVAEPLGDSHAGLHYTMSGEPSETRPLATADHAAAIEAIVTLLSEKAIAPRLEAVGHRVVHGGAEFTTPVVIDDHILESIRSFIPLAPLHNPANIAGIIAARAAFPDTPQIAVFDTAFHRRMPPRAERYAIPESWYDTHGVRRYGFQGINYEWVSEAAARQLPAGVASGMIIAHLGNGCSVAAVENGRSVETSMGFTPLEGLMMGTRSGDIDPAVVPYLADRLKITSAEVVDQLNRQSGLRGVSGVSNDVRLIAGAADRGDQRAKLALEMFVYRASRGIAAARVALARFDALVFTAGIGEHSPTIRAAIVGLLSHLGLVIDLARNSSGELQIDAGSGPAILVIPAGEELAIARAAARLVRGETAAEE